MTVPALLAERVQLPSGWTLDTTLPFPTVWPLTAGHTLVTYAAASKDPAPRSFAHTGLLALVRHDPTGVLTPVFEALGDVEVAGEAYVVPLSSDELARVRALPTIEELFKASGAVDEDAVRARFGFFKKQASWLYRLAAAKHPAFVSWLAI